jgi:tetratricopeptide (TPR) repeat protein
MNTLSWRDQLPADIRAECDRGLPDNPADLIRRLLAAAPHIAKNFIAEAILADLPYGGAVAAAEVFLDHGDLESALEYARTALQVISDGADAWLILARIHLAAGRRADAQAALRRAMRSGLDPAQASRPELYPDLIACMGESTPRFAEIMRPCPLIGPAGPVLSAGAEAVIASVFDAHLRLFENGQRPRPDLLPEPAPAIDVTGRRVFLIQNEHIGADPRFVRNDIGDHLAHSAAAHGQIVSRSAAAHLVLLCKPEVQQPERLGEGIATLISEIAAFKPDVIILDGNFIGTELTLQAHHIAQFRPQGCKVVVTVGDLYDSQPNFLDYWGGSADLVLAFNAGSTHADISDQRDKLFYWPCLPFEPDLFHPVSDGKKLHDLCVLGSHNRARDIYADLLRSYGMDGFYSIHDRSIAAAPDAEQYRRLLASARLVFNNGYITSAESILTGRLFEGILAGSVVMEEAGSDAARLFVPFVHFVPFANIHQLVGFSQFLLKHPDRRIAIASRALAWSKEHLSTQAFWSHLWARLSPKAG